MAVFNSIFYFLIIISVLVIVHELGHFMAAKLFGMRVERFSIGIGRRLFGKIYKGTDYCISLIPFGGYVKILGMLDESSLMNQFKSDAEPGQRMPLSVRARFAAFRKHVAAVLSMSQSPAEPWEYRAKPVWQRLIVITGGVIMNVLLAIAIFLALNLVNGRDLHPVTEVGYVQRGSIAEKAGFLPGDRITAVNGTAVGFWEDAERAITFEGTGSDLRIDIERAQARTTLILTQADVMKLDGERLGMYPKGSRPMIAGLDPEFPAAKAGMLAGDVLISIKDTAVRSSEEVIGIVHGNPGREIAIAWERDGRAMNGRVTPNADGKIGIVIVNDIAGAKETRRYGIGEAASLSVRGVWSIASLTVQSIWRVIEGKASFRQQISGPVKIAKMAAQQAEVGLVSFLNLVAVLSISLAVINILPLPALDGGYVMFLLFEGIFRREVKLGVQYYLLQFGWFLLIGLMVFVLYNDIFH